MFIVIYGGAIASVAASEASALQAAEQWLERIGVDFDSEELTAIDDNRDITTIVGALFDGKTGVERIDLVDDAVECVRDGTQIPLLVARAVYSRVDLLRTLEHVKRVPWAQGILLQMKSLQVAAERVVAAEGDTSWFEEVLEPALEFFEDAACYMSIALWHGKDHPVAMRRWAEKSACQARQVIRMLP